MTDLGGHITEDGRFYCRRCDTVDCDWLGVCPHTPDLWVELNPTSDMAKNRRADYEDK